MLRNDKERVVAELVERLGSVDTLLVADYRGLTHAELDAVRTELLKLGSRFTVAKNTLTRRAADQAGVEGLHELLVGPTAIAFVSEGEAVAVAKVLAETARQTRRLELKGGLLDRKAISADEVRSLATLPPPEVLRGQLLGAIVGPVASIMGIFSAPLRDLVGVLDARISQLESSRASVSEASLEREGAAEPPSEGAEPGIVEAGEDGATEATEAAAEVDATGEPEAEPGAEAGVVEGAETEAAAGEPADASGVAEPTDEEPGETTEA
jgi:large subunit ribosomal protein L10